MTIGTVPIERTNWMRHRLLAAFAAAQLLAVFFVANGPTGDEGIYAWIGMRQAESFPSVIGADWMNGSPWIWPWIAGAAFRLGGLIALRCAAAILSLVALWLVTDAARLWFGHDAGDWSLGFLVLSGPLFALAHLGVYDVPAFAAASAALWCAAHRWRGGGMQWLLGAAATTALSVMTKYAYLFVAPALAAIVVANADRRWRDLLLFASVAAVLVAAHNLLILGTLLPASYPAYQAATPAVPRPLVAAEQAYLALPLIIAILGARKAWRRDDSTPVRILAAAMVGALAVWPLFHIMAGNAQAGHKHVVAGALLAAPLLGRTLSDLRPPRFLIGTFAVWGLFQWATIEYSWPNARPAVAYLVQHVAPGESIRSNAGTFRYLAALHAARLDSDFAEFKGEPAAAGSDWVVWEDPPQDTVPGWLARARTAGYREVLGYRSIHIGADEVRAFGIHLVRSRLFQRVRTAPVP